jgi:hypothetical protein
VKRARLGGLISPSDKTDVPAAGSIPLSTTITAMNGGPISPSDKTDVPAASSIPLSTTITAMNDLHCNWRCAEVTF